jgi:cytochrome c
MAHFSVNGSMAMLAVLIASAASAEAAPDGKALFEKNCGVCHVVSRTEPLRQGPYLAGVVGRKAGKVENFPYSNGLKTATFDWTGEQLDRWITDPQSVIPDSYMMYKQADPAIRASIIDYLATLKAQ